MSNNYLKVLAKKYRCLCNVAMTTLKQHIYMVFHKKDPFLFFSEFTQFMSNLHKILPVVAKEILI